MPRPAVSRARHRRNVLVLQWKRLPFDFQLPPEVSFGQCFIRGFATKLHVSLPHASGEPCRTSPECISFTMENGFLLVFQLLAEVSFGQFFIRDLVPLRLPGFPPAGLRAECIGFSKGFAIIIPPSASLHLSITRFVTSAQKRFVLVRV